jgi:hypothetical protein
MSGAKWKTREGEASQVASSGYSYSCSGDVFAGWSSEENENPVCDDGTVIPVKLFRSWLVRWKTYLKMEGGQGPQVVSGSS